MTEAAGAAARAAAARAVSAVRDHGRSLDAALPEARRQAPQDAGLVASLAYGALRHYRALDYLLGQLIERPLPRRDAAVRALLTTALFERWQLSTPAHAAVSESVNALGALRRPRLRGLVNAVLRRFDREREALLAGLAAETAAVRHSHPGWLAQRFAADWQDAEAVMAAGNTRAPMWLRVNLRHTDRATYLERLAAAGIAAQPHPDVATAVRLADPLPVTRLPGFDAGDASVQDLAAQLAAPLLAAEPGMRVLDACAAPGGKTAHLQERSDNTLDLTALDVDGERMDRVADTLTRLGLRATLNVADASRPDDWWDGRPFDRILLDAPCSATGVIRRHPDIKVLRRPEDIGELARRQQGLLRALWALVAPGGCLLYATCSVLRAENADVISTFCRDHAQEARIDELRVGNIRGVMPAGSAGLQILPGAHDADGFYLARLWRPAEHEHTPGPDLPQ